MRCKKLQTHEKWDRHSLRWKKIAVSMRFLYGKSSSNYKDKNEKANAWMEVAMEAEIDSGE